MKCFTSFFSVIVPCFFLLVFSGCVNSDSSTSYNIEDVFGKENLIPVVIIGSGPAGLSSAVYTCRANLKTLVIEGEEPGGQLVKTSFVENWPGIKRTLGSSAVSIVREQAKTFGAEFLSDLVTYVDFSQWPFIVKTQNGVNLHAMSVIITTGADPRYLKIPGEQEYWGGGVSACAICDAPLYKKTEEVVVVGGGDSAAEEAMQLAPYAGKVTILVRKDSMRASQVMQDNLNGYPNIFIKYNVAVQEVLGDGVFVTGVRLLNTKTGEKTDLKAHGVFLAIGRIPNSKIFKKQLDLDNLGHIKLIGRSQATSVSGVFAAGDVADPVYRQAGVASGNGIKAGLDAERFLTHLGLNTVVEEKLEPSFFVDAQEDLYGLDLEHIATVQEFEQFVKKSEIPVVLDFYTQHCPSCLQMMPKIAAIAKKYEGKIKVYKVDAQEAFEVTDILSIFKVPTLVVFQKGKEIERFQTALSSSEIETSIFEKFSN
ncbi:FAD-dependent oxidoreductase [bacterium]|nr:FAD-dependent oxidoreductase [bacterium]